MVERLGPTSVQLRWPATFARGPVAVFVGLDADAIERRRPLAVVRGREVVVRATDSFPWVSDRHRLYYELVPADGSPTQIVAERRLPLRGADNFRDLGGYATRDGRSVRWGRLFRSNELSGLDAADLAYLRAARIRLICDLRSGHERAGHPDPPVPPRPAEELWLPIEEEVVDPTTVREKIRTGGLPALGLEKAMREAYRAFPVRYADHWKQLLQRLADPEQLPLLFHCTAGKDRTGFGAALVLLTLGVPEETVYEDYLLTSHYRRDFDAFVLRWTPLYSLFRTRPEDLLPLLDARREYLEASLATIDEAHGSFEAYLRDALGVTPELREALEANLLR